MKHARGHDKQRTHKAGSDVQRDPSAGEKALALSPPTYGIDLIDCEQAEERMAKPKRGSLAIQPKLSIGRPGDKYEQEADRMAQAVVKRIKAPLSQSGDQEGPWQIEEQGTLQREPMIQGISTVSGISVAPPIEAAIQRSRGGGHSLPETVRKPMEQTFGADFSEVQIHHNTQSDQFAKSLKASAFTTSQDIFFQKGAYDPSSKDGKALLAHELTHVVQQRGNEAQGPSKSKRGRKNNALMGVGTKPSKSNGFAHGRAGTIQRLAWKDTQWNKAKSAKASTGGGLGVLFVKDDSLDDPVVVKAGEEAGTEVVLAANIHKKLWGEDGGGDTWSLTTPGARLVKPDEAKEMKNKIEDVELQGDAVRAKKIIKDIDNPGTMVFEYSKGTDFADIIKNKKHTKEKWYARWGRTIRRKSQLFPLLQDSDYMKTLGKATAVDILTGNFDRLAKAYNPENWKVDTEEKTVQLIDNVLMGVEFAFKNYPQFQNLTLEESFQAWEQNSWVKDLGDQKYGEISKNVVKNMKDGIIQDLRKEDKKLVAKKLDKSLPLFEDNFSIGLKEGYIRLLDFLKSEREEGYKNLLSAIREEDKDQVKKALNLRLDFFVKNFLGTEGRGK